MNRKTTKQPLPIDTPKRTSSHDHSRESLVGWLGCVDNLVALKKPETPVERPAMNGFQCSESLNEHSADSSRVKEDRYFTHAPIDQNSAEEHEELAIKRQHYG